MSKTGATGSSSIAAGTIVGLSFAAGGIVAVSWGASELRLHRSTSGMVTTTGTLTELDYTSNGRRYTIRVAFEFVVGSEAVAGDRAFTWPPVFRSRESAEAAATQNYGLSQGAPVVIHYDPSDPAVNVLFPDSPPWWPTLAWTAVAVGVTANVVVMCGWAGFAARVVRRRRNRASHRA